MRDKSRLRIIAAATSVFARYGFKRTTMNDIAREAGVSRSTLYGLFSDKEELLQASMIQYFDDAISGINEHLDDSMSLDRQLDLVFEWVVVRGFKMTKQAPDAKDIVDGIHPVWTDALQEKYAEVIDLVVGLLKPYDKQIRAAGMNTRDLAQLLCAASGSLKKVAQNASHLRKMHSDLITLTTAALRDSPSPQ